MQWTEPLPGPTWISHSAYKQFEIKGCWYDVCHRVRACSMALFHLEEFEAAKAALEEGQRLDPSSKQFKPWIRKCQAELDGEGRDIPLS